MEFELLKELVIIFGLAIAVLVSCHRLHIPPIVGFLLTGLVAGPHGLQLVESVHEIETLAEIGIALLLFVIGTEFSLGKLLQIRRLVLLGGLSQVLLTSVFTYALGRVFGLGNGAALLFGFMISFSSTALVLKILQDRAEIDAPFGRSAFSILIFQDLAIVPVMMLIPFLSSEASVAETQELWWVALKGASILIFGGLAARLLVPRIFDLVAKTKNQELFLLTVVVVCFSVAFIAQAAGLSLAIGALLAGLIISESDYSHQALSRILPFQQVFTSLFFVSVGMLLDISYVLSNPLIILGGAILVVALKTLFVIPAGLLTGFSFRSSTISGLCLAQIGEFSFVVASAGLLAKVITQAQYNFLLAVSVLTMSVTPVIISRSRFIADWFCKLKLMTTLQAKFAAGNEQGHLLAVERVRDHILILGFGVSGQLAARAAERAHIPYVAIDLNPERVSSQRAAGTPIIFGDATQEAVIVEAGVQQAKMAVIAISDFVSTRRIVELYRRLNASLYLIVRTHFNAEIEELYALGANEVISEEYESSVEVASRVLTKLLTPGSEITQFVDEIRSDGYEMIRTPLESSSRLGDLDLHVPNVDLISFRIDAGAALIGESIRSADLRRKHGITLLLVKRKDLSFPNPEPDFVFQAEDILVVLGPISDNSGLQLACGCATGNADKSR